MSEFERPLRNLKKMQTANHGHRTLMESAMLPELVDVLQDWRTAGSNGVLFGGLGLSYYIKPRMTQDLDFLFLNQQAIPATMEGFDRISPGVFQHNKTLVKVNVFTPESVNIPTPVAEQIISTAVICPASVGIGETRRLSYTYSKVPDGGIVPCPSRDGVSAVLRRWPSFGST